MYAWYEAGYLPRGLYIREVNDTDFQPLSLVIERIEKTQSMDSTSLLQTPPGLITIKNRPQFYRRNDILPDITRFMKASNLLFNPYPIIEGNHIDVADLSSTVVTNGGSKRITVERGWATVAVSMGLPTEEFPNAPQELENYWNQNLLEYEESLEAQPQEQRQALSQTTGNVTKDSTAHVNPEITVSADDDENSAPCPSFELQSFGPEAPEGYQYQCSDCTGKRKALLISIDSLGHFSTMAFLMENYGFERDNLMILSYIEKSNTHLPTKENILKGMAWLVGGARTNDCLFFHYAGPMHKITDPDEEEKKYDFPKSEREQDGPFIHAFHPVDSDKAGLLTSNDMYRIMIQPLRQGVRLTAFFDYFCDISPLKSPYIYSAEAVLEEADFSARATRSVLARHSSNARTILRSMTSLNSSTQASLPDYGLENFLIKATKTSPADVIVMYSCRDTADPPDSGDKLWTAVLAFFQAHRLHRRESYAQILSRMQAQVPPGSSIRRRLSCSHPLDMQARFIM